MRASGMLATLAAWAAATAAGAQDGPKSPEPSCAGKAALFQTEKGLKLWVVRRGEMKLPENPLRPLSDEHALVLQVVVNGRSATAFGPDFANLRQGGAARDVERQGVEPIRWEDGSAPLPDQLRVVAEDGSVLIGPMRFAGCEDPPAAKAVAPVAAARLAPGAGQRSKKKVAEPAGREPPGMPQGAINGLSLPHGVAP